MCHVRLYLIRVDNIPCVVILLSHATILSSQSSLSKDRDIIASAVTKKVTIARMMVEQLT